MEKDVFVPVRRINEIVRGVRAATADTALRLARCFGTSERFWLNLPSRFDVELQRNKLGGQKKVSGLVIDAGGDRYSFDVMSSREAEIGKRPSPWKDC